jgi:hypothetical protein
MDPSPRCAQHANDVSHMLQLKMIYDRSGKPRGYAFAEFEHERDMLCLCPQCPLVLTLQLLTNVWMATRSMASVLLLMLSERGQ